MDCRVYKGSLAPDTYVYVADEAALEDLPEPLVKQMGEFVPVMTLTLEPGRRLARTDADTVITSIRQQGFYLQMPPPKEPSLAATLNPREDAP